MMHVESRNFQPDADVGALHTLIADCWQAYGPMVTFHVGDLHWRLRPQPNRWPERDIRLWHTTDQLIAFAWFDPPDSGDLQCHPDADRESIESESLTWLEHRAQACGAQSITVGAFQSDSMRGELFQSRGYRRQSSFLCHMTQSLAMSPAPGSVQHGYSIHCTAIADLDSLARTIAHAFGSQPKPTSAYRAMRSGRFYRNDLDHVVKSDRGDVVAFCIAWLDEHNQVGLLEPVGCHPDYRRQGLASAAVTSALKALYRVGARTAVVYPNGDDHVACAFYTACGFRPVANDYDWQLTF